MINILNLHILIMTWRFVCTLHTFSKVTVEIKNSYWTEQYNSVFGHSCHTNQNNTFMTSIYRKKTFTGLYTKWDFFTPRKYKINLIRSLTYRYYRVCSSGSLLQSALNDLRKLLLQNGYQQGIINYHINDVLNKNRNQHSNPKMHLWYALVWQRDAVSEFLCASHYLAV